MYIPKAGKAAAARRRTSLKNMAEVEVEAGVDVESSDSERYKRERLRLKNVKKKT